MTNLEEPENERESNEGTALVRLLHLKASQGGRERRPPRRKSLNPHELSIINDSGKTPLTVPLANGNDSFASSFGSCASADTFAYSECGDYDVEDGVNQHNAHQEVAPIDPMERCSMNLKNPSKTPTSPHSTKKLWNSSTSSIDRQTSRKITETTRWPNQDDADPMQAFKGVEIPSYFLSKQTRHRRNSKQDINSTTDKVSKDKDASSKTLNKAEIWNELQYTLNQAKLANRKIKKSPRSHNNVSKSLKVTNQSQIRHELQQTLDRAKSAPSLVEVEQENKAGNTTDDNLGTSWRIISTHSVKEDAVADEESPNDPTIEETLPSLPSSPDSPGLNENCMSRVSNSWMDASDKSLSFDSHEVTTSREAATTSQSTTNSLVAQNRSVATYDSGAPVAEDLVKRSSPTVIQKLSTCTSRHAPTRPDQNCGHVHFTDTTNEVSDNSSTPNPTEKKEEQNGGERQGPDSLTRRQTIENISRTSLHSQPCHSSAPSSIDRSRHRKATKSPNGLERHSLHGHQCRVNQSGHHGRYTPKSRPRSHSMHNSRYLDRSGHRGQSASNDRLRHSSARTNQQLDRSGHNGLGGSRHSSQPKSQNPCSQSLNRSRHNGVANSFDRSGHRGFDHSRHKSVAAVYSGNREKLTSSSAHSKSQGEALPSEPGGKSSDRSASKNRETKSQTSKAQMCDCFDFRWLRRAFFVILVIGIGLGLTYVAVIGWNWFIGDSDGSSDFYPYYSVAIEWETIGNSTKSGTHYYLNWNNTQTPQIMEIGQSLYFNGGANKVYVALQSVSQGEADLDVSVTYLCCQRVFHDVYDTSVEDSEPGPWSTMQTCKCSEDTLSIEHQVRATVMPVKEVHN